MLQGSDALIFSLLIGQFMSVFSGLLKFLRDLFITSIEISPNSELYPVFEETIEELPCLSANNIYLTNSSSSASYRPRNLEIARTKPNLGNGIHIYIYNWTILIVSKSINKEHGIESKNIKIMIPFCTKNTANKFIENIQNKFNTNKSKILICTWQNQGNMWQPKYNSMRRLETVVIPSEIKEEIKEDYCKFTNNKNWYYSKGIPYHRGYLFAGKPGTGKTSLAVALACKFEKAIFMLPISHLADKDTMINMILGIPDNSIILIEDIDRVDKVVNKPSQSWAMKTGERIDVDPQECFRNLLQILDGVMTPPGSVFILTTNNPDTIDPALLRYGRVDRRYDFTYATKEQAEELFIQFFPEENDLSKEFAKNVPENVVMAQIQEHLIRNIEDAVMASKWTMSSN